MAALSPEVAGLAVYVSRMNQTLPCRMLRVLRTAHVDRPITTPCVVAHLDSRGTHALTDPALQSASGRVLDASTDREPALCLP
jgi:hypothetical protein